MISNPVCDCRYRRFDDNRRPQLASFTKEHNKPWAQIYDGKYWEAAIAQLYVVQSIPTAFLVDGDTGKVIASTGLRGAALAETIEKALTAKKTATR